MMFSRRQSKMPGQWLFTAVPIFIGVVFVLMLAAALGFAYVALTADPKAIAREAGEIAGSFRDGMAPAR